MNVSAAGRGWLLALGLLGMALTIGCSHYRLGTGGQLTFSRLYIAPVENPSGIPQAAGIFSAQLRERFVRDGRIALVESPDQADAVLSVALVSLGREVATVRPDDTGLARKFNLSLTARLNLRQAGEPLIADRMLSVQRQIFTDSGQLQAEYEIMPLLAADLAESVHRASVDVW